MGKLQIWSLSFQCQKALHFTCSLSWLGNTFYQSETRLHINPLSHISIANSLWPRHPSVIYILSGMHKTICTESKSEHWKARRSLLFCPFVCRASFFSQPRSHVCTAGATAASRRDGFRRRASAHQLWLIPPPLFAAAARPATDRRIHKPQWPGGYARRPPRVTSELPTSVPTQLGAVHEPRAWRTGEL